MYFAVAILVVTCIVLFLTNKIKYSIATLCGVVLIVVILRLIDIRYYWFLNEVLRVKNGKLVFTYDQIVSSLGRTGVKDEIIKKINIEQLDRKVLNELIDMIYVIDKNNVKIEFENI